MNLFEILAFAFNLACGIIFGHYLSSVWGMVGWFIGVPIGFVLGIVVIKGVDLIFGLWHIWRPLRPRCKKGLCQSSDYILISASCEGAVFLCQCGGRYIHKRDKFMEILPDGSAHIYMRRHRYFGKWELDE